MKQCLIILSVLISAFSFSQQVTFKEAYSKAFKIGTAVNDNIVTGKDKKQQDIVLQHFNTITPENCMKAEVVNPLPGKFDFSQADAFVEFGRKNNLFIVGHTLVWKNQTPDWFFKNEDGSPKSKAQIKERLHDHIKLVAGRYAGKIQAWDVVNEVIDDDGSYRNEGWVKGIGDGDELMRLSFQYAAKYSPNTELYYNDFNAWRPEKVKGIVRMVKMLQAAGIRIDGIGIQGHWGLDYPKNQYIEDAIDAYAACGIKVMITEIDVDVLPVTKEGQIIGQAFMHKQFQNEEFKTFLDPYTKGLPKDIDDKLTERYAELFRIFYKKRDKLDRVTTWGMKDEMSWKNDYPIPGRTNYPLLWDRNGNPKKALLRILEIPNNK